MSTAGAFLKVSKGLTKLYRRMSQRRGTPTAGIRSCFSRRFHECATTQDQSDHRSYSFIAAKLFRLSRPVYTPRAVSLLPYSLVRIWALRSIFIFLLRRKALA